MTSEQDRRLRRIFNTLHDGNLISAKDVNGNLRLEISIQYLAERISENHTSIFVELHNPTKFSFNNWAKDELVAGIDQIVRLKPEFLRCDEKYEGGVKITCCSVGGPGGELFLDCDDIQLYDQDLRILSPEQLFELSHTYWENWSRQVELNRKNRSKN